MAVYAVRNFGCLLPAGEAAAAFGARVRRISDEWVAELLDVVAIDNTLVATSFTPVDASVFGGVLMAAKAVRGLRFDCLAAHKAAAAFGAGVCWIVDERVPVDLHVVAVSVALTTPAMSVLAEVRVVVVIWVPCRTHKYPFGGASEVLCDGDGFEMIRVATQWDCAQVVDCQIEG